PGEVLVDAGHELLARARGIQVLDAKQKATGTRGCERGQRSERMPQVQSPARAWSKARGVDQRVVANAAPRAWCAMIRRVASISASTCASFVSKEVTSRSRALRSSGQR